MGRWAGRAGAVVVGLVAAVATAGIAFAHVDVEADPATAGATNAKVTFSAEAESSTAGIKSVRIVLPTGIAPADVRLDKAPSGWTLTPGADGYTVGGTALPKGEEAVHSIIVARLPDAPTLVFKALVTYSDGDVDRWIEEKSTANPNPENPAPVLTLAAAPAATTTAPAPTTTAAAPPTSPAAAPTNPDNGSSAWVWWVVAVVVILAAAGAYLVLRRRRAAG